jgi:integrase
MPIGKIIKSVVERLPPNEWLWDTSVKGFGARRQNNGVFYYLRYRVGSRQHMRSIGRHGSPWTPDTARREAQQALGEVAKGRDPFAERGRVAETFAAEVPRFLERKRAALRPRTFVEVQRHLTTQAGSLARLRLSEITRRTIAEHLAQIEATSGPIARNRVRGSLSTFFAWTISEGFIEPPGPVAGTDKAAEGSRDHILKDPELAAIWRALSPGDYGDIVRLLVLTGQRREEIGGLRWSEVDLERGVIRLGAERTKNKRPHEVPLAPLARAILASRRPQGPSPDGAVFGSNGAGGWSARKAALEKRLAGLGPWRLHDLRRTCATGMAELGVAPHIVEAVLNHVSGHKGGVAGIYNRARYAGEVRDALERWAAHVEAIVSDTGDAVAVT